MAVDAYDVYGSYKAMRTKALVKAFAKGALKHPEGDGPEASGTSYASMETGSVDQKAASRMASSSAEHQSS